MSSSIQVLIGGRRQLESALRGNTKESSMSDEDRRERFIWDSEQPLRVIEEGTGETINLEEYLARLAVEEKAAMERALETLEGNSPGSEG